MRKTSTSKHCSLLLQLFDCYLRRFLAQHGIIFAISPNFPEQNWKGADFYPKDSPSRCLVDNCINATNWDALRQYASTLNNGIKCNVLPKITNGLYHLVCLLEFENKTRWVARIQMNKSTERLAKRLQNEIDTMALIRERSEIPVPQVFGYEIDDNNPTGVAFMLIEFLPGDAATDADGGYKAHHSQIPSQHRGSFYRAAAQIQVQMTSVRLPKIGTIVKSKDGSYDIGPFPDIGGPFETATAFFDAWAAYAKFPKSTTEIQKSMKNGPINQVLKSIVEFPLKLRAVTNGLSSCDDGPFPVSHRDFFHSNIIVDNRYRILGVIDWEGACTVPWELVEFPLFLETVPFPMDAPWNYDKNGEPLAEDTRQRWQERKEYVQMVARAEAAAQIDDKLTAILNNQNVQNLAYAMRVYLEPGKLGFYDKVIEPFEMENVHSKRQRI